MSVYAYAAARLAVSFIGIVFTAVLLTSVSVLAPGRSPAACISVTVLLLPYIGKISGADFLYAVSFADFCAPEGLSMLPAIGCVPAAAAVFSAAYRKWNA